MLTHGKITVEQTLMRRRFVFIAAFGSYFLDMFKSLSDVKKLSSYRTFLRISTGDLQCGRRYAFVELSPYTKPHVFCRATV